MTKLELLEALKVQYKYLNEIKPFTDYIISDEALEIEANKLWHIISKDIDVRNIIMPLAEMADEFIVSEDSLKIKFNISLYCNNGNKLKVRDMWIINLGDYKIINKENN